MSKSSGLRKLLTSFFAILTGFRFLCCFELGVGQSYLRRARKFVQVFLSPTRFAVVSFFSSRLTFVVKRQLSFHFQISNILLTPFQAGNVAVHLGFFHPRNPELPSGGPLHKSLFHSPSLRKSGGKSNVSSNWTRLPKFFLGSFPGLT